MRLEPLAVAHAEGLWASSREPGLWTYLPVAPFGGVDDVRRWIDDSLQAQRNGTDIPFATVRRSDGRGYYRVCHDGPVFRAEAVVL